MKSFYVTGCTAGMHPHEIDAKFIPIMNTLFEMGAERVESVHLIENNKELSFAQKLEAREQAVKNSDCLVYTPDMKDSLETQVEFTLANRLGKHLRPITDMEYIRYALSKPKRKLKQTANAF